VGGVEKKSTKKRILMIIAVLFAGIITGTAAFGYVILESGQ
jgi:sensor domain CHASE-containing protein